MSSTQPNGPRATETNVSAGSARDALPFGTIFSDRPQHRVKRAAGATAGSIVAHILLVAIGTYLLTRPRPTVDVVDREIPLGTLVYLETAPGPGGGGGGSPEPAPPQPIVIPRTDPPKPIPIPVEPTPPPLTPPPPTLTVPVMTANAESAQATGASVVLTAGGGGGRGVGIGSGTGDGVGPGTGTGFGDGMARPGAGINNPFPLRQPRPNYTSEAMRAKIAGTVVLEAEVLDDGTIGRVRVIRSLDRIYGLDQEAIKAARQWVFRPATDRTGKPIPIVVTLEIGFALH